MDQARNESALTIALEATAQVGLEWRAFERSTRTVVGRLRWLFTGRLTALTEHERHARAAAATRDAMKASADAGETEDHVEAAVQAPVAH